LRHKVRKIISGGQTGADRAALDVAIALKVSYGGHVPQGRWAEDGRIPDLYKGLVETESPDPADRTRINVIQSDATVIISHGKLKGGSLLTWRRARNARVPLLHVDLDRQSFDEAVVATRAWLDAAGCDVLNVAGPRESKDQGIYEETYKFLNAVLAP
jgi:hypothetical protein